jgi:mannuronan 5-epimerase
MASQVRPNRTKRRIAILVAAILASAGFIGYHTGDSASAVTLESVMASSGANLDTNYPIPSGAIFVSPTGTDGALGTQTAPLRSIAAAISRSPSGGTVVLRGGTYRQAIGTINKPISLQAYPHERPVLTGLDVITGWTQAGSHWVTTTWTSPFPQDQWRDEEISSTYPVAGKVEQAWRNGVKLRQVASLSEATSGKFFVDPSSRKLYVADDPTTATMELASRDKLALFSTGSDNSKIRGLRVTSYAPVHLDAKGMVVIASPGMTIEQSQFDNSSATGVMTAAANVTMNHVTVVDNGSVGVGMYKGHNSLVQNSQFSRNNAEHFNVTNCGGSCTIAGIKATRGDQMKFINNAFVDNDSTGWWCDISCSNVTVSGNAVSGSTVNGMFYEISSVGSFTNNYIANAARGFKVAGSDQVTITNNTFVNNTQQTGIYDDPRLSTEDPYYGGQLGQSWNTTDLILDSNTFIGGSKTTRLLDNNATEQVAGPEMFASAKDNAVTGNQTMVWCRTEGSCALYSTIASWAAASGQSFGTVGTATSTASAPATTASPTTTTVASATAAPTTTAATTATAAPTTAAATAAPTTAAATTTTAAPTTTTIPADPANLLKDPSFESGRTWNEFGSARVWSSSSQHRSGDRSLAIAGTTNGKDVDGATASPLPVSRTVADRTYTASCYVTSTAPVDVRLRFQEYQQDWVRKTAAFRGPTVTTQSIGTWSKISVTYQARYDDMLLPLTVYTTDLELGGAKLYVDDCSVEAI